MKFLLCVAVNMLIFMVSRQLSDTHISGCIAGFLASYANLFVVTKH